MANSCKDCKHDKVKCVGASRAGSHRYCFEQKATTNADRIRAMTDEELARFAAKKIVNLENQKMIEQGHTPTATQLSELGQTMYCILMRWLREPAEGERVW